MGKVKRIRRMDNVCCVKASSSASFLSDPLAKKLLIV